MPIFRVMLSGQKVIIRTEAGNDVCGFVRNEYVSAQSRDEAIGIAKQKVQELIEQNEAIATLSDSPLNLTVDEVEEGVPRWKLTVNESFVFFEVE